MPTFSHISGAEPSTVTFKLATVAQTRNSSAMHQEIMALGDPDTSNAIAAVLNAVPASTAWGLAVRQVGNSSIQGNSTVFQGTSPWLIAGNSTVVVVSGNSSVFQASSAWQVQVTNQARVSNSTASDFLAQISGNSTAVIQGNCTAFQGGAPWTVADVMQSSVAPSSGSSGLIVRQVIDNILTTASTNAFASTSLSVQSSGAALRSYVVAYSITSTVQAPTAVKFYSSGTMTWPVVLAALSSAVSGVNLAVSAPAYLFRTAASEALTLQVASSVAGFKVGVSYFRAP